MALRTSRIPDEAVVPGLPAGFDDDTSDFWTPPELRPFYDRSATADHRRIAEMARWKQNGIVIELPIDRIGSRDRIARQLRPLDDPDDEAIGLHALACRDARQALDDIRRREEAAALAKADVCPYCGRDNAGARMAPPIHLPSGLSMPPGCNACRREAERADLDFSAAAKVRDGRSRRDVVADAVRAAHEASS